MSSVLVDVLVKLDDFKEILVDLTLEVCLYRQSLPSGCFTIAFLIFSDLNYDFLSNLASGVASTFS